MIGLTKLAPFIGILSLIIAWLIYGYVKKQPNGTPLMQELEDAIHTGAMAFFKEGIFRAHHLYRHRLYPSGLGDCVEDRHLFCDRRSLFHGGRIFRYDRSHQRQLENSGSRQ